MKTKNWKRLFYLLLGLNVVVAACLFMFFLFITSGDGQVSKIPEPPSKHDIVSFEITTNKEDLNRMIQYYLAKEQKSNFTYHVNLSDEVEFNGVLPVLGEEIQVKLTFEPVALENGDIELRQKDITIGKFSLPASLVLQFIHNSKSLPEWIIVQPDDQKVYLALQKFKLKSDSTVVAKEINLKEDKLRFSLQVPIK